jgi:hypothetical protein
MIGLKKINDLNIHPIKMNSNLENAIKEDKKIDFNQIENFTKNFDPKYIQNKNIMIMNENFFFDKNNIVKLSKLKKENSKLDFTYLVNFKKYNQTIKFINENNLIRRIKLHSYFQKITSEDFKNIIKICKICEKKKISILIDASYGTLNLFKYDNLKLIVEIAEHIKKVPIVVLHSGGSNVIKAMIIALSTNNIFFETSFSLNFYQNSNLWNDFNFAFKKIGYEKIIYGSDIPYVKIEDSEQNIKKFFKEFNLSIKNIENIMFNNYFKV